MEAASVLSKFVHARLRFAPKESRSPRCTLFADCTLSAELKTVSDIAFEAVLMASAATANDFLMQMRHFPVCCVTGDGGGGEHVDSRGSVRSEGISRALIRALRDSVCMLSRGGEGGTEGGASRGVGGGDEGIAWSVGGDWGGGGGDLGD